MQTLRRSVQVHTRARLVVLVVARVPHVVPVLLIARFFLAVPGVSRVAEVLHALNFRHELDRGHSNGLFIFRLGLSELSLEL